MTSQEERRAATWGAVLDAATSLFGTAGFEGTSVDDVARAAGVSKGGLYHYVPDKGSLFLRVFERIQAALSVTVVAEAAVHRDPIDQLVAGCQTFLRCCLDAPTARVLLLDGPMVLGWETWRQLDEKQFLALIKGALDAVDESRPNALRAHLLLGALDEAALLMTKERNPDAACERISEEVERLVRALIA